jgi:nucleotide-binding universal stress UspA family protein
MASKTQGSAADLASQAGERVAINRILFATDFSAVSSNAASYAKALAHRFSSSIEIAHVFDPAPFGSHEEAMKGLPVKERRRLVEDNLKRLQEDFSASGINAQTILPEGLRASVSLLKIVREQRMDLIVAGTRSKSGMERQLLGSTAEQLVRNATCPVFTVGPHAKQPPPLFFERIVYATDFLLEAAKAAVYALLFAEDSGAHLYVCHVLVPQETRSKMHDLPESAFHSALKQMIPDSSYDWCNPESVVEHGEAIEAILEFAARVHADLIVLGAHKDWSWLTPADRGIVPGVWSRSTCPILTAC